jgi:tripartite-type tricarboxylate transporter receptor subunit TctC
MRMLGVAAEQRFARWPEVPTAREQGFDVEHQLPTGFIAPRGLPPEVAAHLEAALLRMVDDPAHAVLLQRLNLAPWRRDAAAYAAHVRDLFNTMPALLREIGMLPAQGATTR